MYCGLYKCFGGGIYKYFVSKSVFEVTFSFTASGRNVIGLYEISILIDKHTINIYQT